MISEHGGSGDR